MKIGSQITIPNFIFLFPPVNLSVFSFWHSMSDSLAGNHSHSGTLISQ